MVSFLFLPGDKHVDWSSSCISLMILVWNAGSDILFMLVRHMKKKNEKTKTMMTAVKLPFEKRS